MQLKENHKIKNKKLFIFSVRTLYEAYFFCEIVKNIDVKCLILSFNEEASKLCAQKKVDYINIFNKKKYFDIKKIKNLNRNKIFHEKNEFNLKDVHQLKIKYLNYYAEIKKKLKNLGHNFEIIVFQEIGGFVSHLSLFYYCKNFKIDHYFLEPSFFKNRFICLKNSFLIPKFKIYKKYNKSTEKLLNNLINKKPLSFISIHKRRYRKAISKLFDLNNIIRVFSKIYKKYVLGYHYDYQYIFSYIFQHIGMAFKSLIQIFIYSNSVKNKFVYFPLHVPNDISLTLRAKKFYNQYDVIERLIKFLPKNFKLVIKEHPSFVGKYELFRLISIINKNQDKLLLVNPKINSYDLIKKAEIVITINSKSGAEAIILNKPYISFANSFYESLNGINTFKDLKKILKNKKYSFRISKYKNLYFINSLVKFTYEGELFNSSKSNIKFFKSFFSNF